MIRSAAARPVAVSNWAAGTIGATVVLVGASRSQLADLVIEHANLTDLSRWRAHHRRSMLRTKTLTPEATRGVGSKDPCPCGTGFKFGRCHAR